MSALRETWHVVTSGKFRQRGNAFLLRDETFVLKVYKSDVAYAKELAEYVARQFNKMEARRDEPPPAHAEALILENLRCGGYVLMGHMFAQSLRPEFLMRLTEDFLVLKPKQENENVG